MGKKIKVLYIAAGGPYGSELSLKCLLESNLSKSYIVPKIIVPSYNRLKYQNINNAEYIKLPLDFETYNRKAYKSLLHNVIHNFFKRPLKRLLSYILLQKVIYSFKPDLIHTNVGVYSIGYKLARLNKIPHIWHIREFQTLDMRVKIIGGLKRRKTLFNNKYNFPIAITKSIYNYFELNRNNRSLVIYNGIKSKEDIVFYKNKENYLLYVGQIKESKGVEDIIDAFCLYNKKINSDLKLVLIGDETQNFGFTQKLKQKIEINKLNNKVVFKGLQSSKVVDLYMQKALAIVVASYNEALGRVTAEAMFNGCLVIGRNTAGTKEQFDIGKEKIGSEIALRYHAVEELVDIIRRVDNNINYFFEMIRNSQKVVIDIYSIEQYSKKIIDLYNSII